MEVNLGRNDLIINKVLIDAWLDYGMEKCMPLYKEVAI